jgi:hypothetical protein
VHARGFGIYGAVFWKSDREINHHSKNDQENSRDLNRQFFRGANLPFGDSNIEIGNAGEPASEEGPPSELTMSFIAGIRKVTTRNANAIPVVIDSARQLDTVSSSQRYNHEIKPMDRANEAILALKPVTFEYNSDKTNTPQFGFIAEQVAEVDPDLVAHRTI